MELRADAIAEWAGVKGSIDLPVRTYSSGMIARLAFSVATDDNADLILIDEVLSVGDAEFQSKSKTRMNRLLGSGAAVVLVTHDLETVRTIATKALWINRGKVQAYGQPSEVINFYLNA
jgi:ABC-type polysaccharide/polyol phosphate transport system ATPase subunit